MQNRWRLLPSSKVFRSGQNLPMHFPTDNTVLPANMRVLNPFLETEVVTYYDDDSKICACVIQHPNVSQFRQDYRPVVLLKKVREAAQLKEPLDRVALNNEYSILMELLSATQTRAKEVLKNIQASTD